MNQTNTRDREDRILAEQFLDGDNDAFDTLVGNYQNMVYNVCYRMMGNHADACDCAQDVFIKVFSSLKTFEFRSSFSTWLYRIAMNTCKNRHASLFFRVRKKMLRIDAPREVEEETRPFEISDESLSPGRVIEQKEKEKHIQKAINKLNTAQKTLIILRDIEGKPYEEIGRITGCKMGTVKSKLARARLALREKLKKE